MREVYGILMQISIFPNLPAKVVFHLSIKDKFLLTGEDYN